MVLTAFCGHAERAGDVPHFRGRQAARAPESGAASLSGDGREARAGRMRKGGPQGFGGGRASETAVPVYPL